MTISHLHLWAYEPLETLKWLASIVRACEGQKGGALASAVYGFSHHGDAGVKQLVKRILEKVCDPLHTMLVRWIAEGELDDPRKEFFIEARSDVVGDRMWHEKYQVRDSMVPTFISKAQARKILGTGKSINFLREVCKDSAPLQERRRESFKQNAEDSNGKTVLLEALSFEIHFRCLIYSSRSPLRHGSGWTAANYDGNGVQRDVDTSRRDIDEAVQPDGTPSGDKRLLATRPGPLYPALDAPVGVRDRLFCE